MSVRVSGRSCELADGVHDFRRFLTSEKLTSGEGLRQEYRKLRRAQDSLWEIVDVIAPPCLRDSFNDRCHYSGYADKIPRFDTRFD